ncbi:hypothetical protein F2Q70_00010273 [Brassica cretica]|uniref:Uncharacterized protein n=1 Tax=Brassica cretica TaxID=69181 RepID=A0A8S9M848_BRACR|nr:hypothetical protein F2Q70_00010273 [Brassica cretica]
MVPFEVGLGFLSSLSSSKGEPRSSLVKGLSMVVLRSPSDIPSSSATVLRSALGAASSSTAAPSSPLKIPSSSTGAPSSLPDVPSSSATVLRLAPGAASSQDDIEIVGVEDDGALGSAGGEQNGTGDVNVDEESEQDEFDGDGDHAAIGGDEMRDRDGVDGRSDYFSGERDDFSGEHDSFGGEQNSVSGSPGIDVVGDGSDDGDGGSDRRADVTDILRKIKQESLVASLADSLDAYGDPCVYLKKKKRVRKVSERPRSFIDPLVNHPDPSESFPSIVDEDTVKWVSANCCRNGVIEARIPGEDERPWTVPDGWLCVYDFWFTEYHLWFPLPEAGCGVVGERKRKMLCWIKKFFYVRIAPSSVPDVSDMSVPFRSIWNPYNGHHLVGVPLAPGDSECIEYFKEMKARDWTVVRRSEQNGVSGSPGIDVVGDGSDDSDGGSDRRADVSDILRKIKHESLVASFADSLDAFGDPCVYLKKKKRVMKVSERPRSFIGPLVNHSDPSESFPSIVDEDTVKWVSANCCRNGVIEARIPGEDERPLTVPDGWLCVYDFWFTEYHLWFPLPRLLLVYCDEHLIALAQLTPAAIRNVVAALFTAADIGVHMSLCLFESIAHITRCDKTDGAFYVSMKAGCGVVGERKRKTLYWIKKFFYVRIAPSSVPDVSDMSVPFRSIWNPYNGRHLVGVPLAPGDSECVEYFKETKARDWTVVRRSEVWRCIPFIDSGRHLVGVPLAPGDSECVEYFKETKARDWTVVRRSEVWRRIPFIDSACWRKMDLSEIPSLVDCFAGGSDDAPVVESRKEVVVAGSEKVLKKRVAAGRSFKDAPASKSRKVASSDVELPLVVESPAAEKATFEPFEHSFNGLSSGCGDLFKLFQSPGGVDGLPFDRSEWYQEFARHLAIATKFANKLVVNQDEELEEVKAELEKTKAELASIKDKADNSEEMAALRGKYEAEKKVPLDALEEVEKLTAKIALNAERVKKRQAVDLERFKKEKEVASRKYRRAVTRHDDVLATFNSRMKKVRRYVENQKVVRMSMYGLNQIMGVLDAARTWRKEGISIPDGKVKRLENELVQRKEKANLVVRVEFEPNELADLPSFDFTRPLSPVHLSMTAGIEDAAKARSKEEDHRREEANRRRV